MFICCELVSFSPIKALEVVFQGKAICPSYCVFLALSYFGTLGGGEQEKEGGKVFIKVPQESTNNLI